MQTKMDMVSEAEMEIIQASIAQGDRLREKETTQKQMDVVSEAEMEIVEAAIAQGDRLSEKRDSSKAPAELEMLNEHPLPGSVDDIEEEMTTLLKESPVAVAPLSNSPWTNTPHFSPQPASAQLVISPTPPTFNGSPMGMPLGMPIAISALTVHPTAADNQSTTQSPMSSSPPEKMTVTEGGASATQLSLNVKMPYTKAAFDADKQKNYKEAMATAAGTTPADVDIPWITEAGWRKGNSITAVTTLRYADRWSFLIARNPANMLAKINVELMKRGLRASTGVSTWSDPFDCRMQDRGWKVSVWQYQDAETGEFPGFDWETKSFTNLVDPHVTVKVSTEIMYEEYEWKSLGAPDYYFAAICWGYLRVCTEGEYTFWTESDDGSMLYVDTKRIVENGGKHPPQKKEGKVDLSPGFHVILVQFFQCEGGATLKVTYSGPDTGGKVQPVRLDIASDPLWSSPSQLQVIINNFPEAVQEPGPDGRLPLHWASVSGSPAGVETLLNACPETATVADNARSLPLHVAAQRNPNKEVIEVLLKVFPTAASMQDKYDNLPCDVAEKNNNQAVLEMLLKAACWESILIQAEMDGFVGTTDDKTLEELLRSSGDVCISALQRDRPLLASLYLSNVLARFSRRQRSMDMQVASNSDDRAVALEQLARFVARDLISWCSLFRKFEGNRSNASVVLDSRLQYSSKSFWWAGSGELDSDEKWCPAQDNHDEFFQMDVGRVTKIKGVVTRGSGDDPLFSEGIRQQWVTSYHIKFSSDLKKWENVHSTSEQRKEVVKKSEVWKNNEGAEGFQNIRYGRDIQKLVVETRDKNEDYIEGDEKFFCGRELQETKGQCGPNGQCESCKQFQNTLFDGNSDADTPFSVVFDQHIEARYLRIIPQTWEKGISMRAGLLIDAPQYLEREVDECLEFMVDHKLKTILSDSVCVRIVMEKWNGRPWQVFAKRFGAIVRSIRNISILFFTFESSHSNLCVFWCVWILVLIARIIVGVIFFVIFLPLGFCVLVIVILAWLEEKLRRRAGPAGVLFLAVVNFLVMVLSFLLVAPYLIVCAVIVGPIASLVVPWPPLWRFLLNKTAYVGLCVIIWYLPRLEEEDIGAEAKNLALEVAAAVLLVSFIWDELSGFMIRISIKSFRRGVTDADLKAKITNAELLVKKAKQRQRKTVNDAVKNVDKTYQKLFPKDDPELAELPTKKELDVAINKLKEDENIQNLDDVVKKVTSFSTSLKRDKAGKELVIVINLLKQAKTKQLHDLESGKKELEKAKKVRKRFEENNSFIDRFIVSLTDVAFWYTNDIWNCIDIISHLVALAAGVTRGCLYAGVPNLEPTAVAQLHMWAVLLLWARLVTILHVSSFLGPLLHIVEVMLTKDLPQFLILVVLMMVPFIGSLSHRFGDDCSVESKPCSDPSQNFNGFGSAGWSFLKMFVDAGKGAPLDIVDGSWGPQELFILYSADILLLIALVNLLIAQFSKTFDTVFENSTKEYLLRRAELLMEWKNALPYPPPFNVVVTLWRAAAWLLRNLWRTAASLSRRVLGCDPFEQQWLYWTRVDCPGADDLKVDFSEEKAKSFEKDKLHCKCSHDHHLKMVKAIYEEGWYCDVCSTLYGESPIPYTFLHCVECPYNLCKRCAKKIIEEKRKEKEGESKFNLKSLVPQNIHAEWRKKLLEDFEEHAEFGSEAQMEKFKGVMLKAKDKTQAKLANLGNKIENIENMLKAKDKSQTKLENKIENIEKLLQVMAQKLDGHNASLPPTVCDDR